MRWKSIRTRRFGRKHLEQSNLNLQFRVRSTKSNIHLMCDFALDMYENRLHIVYLFCRIEGLIESKRKRFEVSRIINHDPKGIWQRLDHVFLPSHACTHMEKIGVFIPFRQPCNAGALSPHDLLSMVELDQRLI